MIGVEPGFFTSAETLRFSSGWRIGEPTEVIRTVGCAFLSAGTVEAGLPIRAGADSERAFEAAERPEAVPAFERRSPEAPCALDAACVPEAGAAKAPERQTSAARKAEIHRPPRDPPLALSADPALPATFASPTPVVLVASFTSITSRKDGARGGHDSALVRVGEARADLVDADPLDFLRLLIGVVFRC